MEDYYPPRVVASVINERFIPTDGTPVKESELRSNKRGKSLIKHYVDIIRARGGGDPEGYLKRMLGLLGTQEMKKQNMPVPPVLKDVFKCVKEVVYAPKP